MQNRLSISYIETLCKSVLSAILLHIAFYGRQIFNKEGIYVKKDGFYSSGEFAKKAQVTLRTIRYYDKQNILKPTLVTQSGARFYTDGDFARLQQILLLKYLGFSLEDIRELTITDTDSHLLAEAMQIQRKLVADRIEQMQVVQSALSDTINALETNETIDWSRMLNLIHLTSMEKSMKNQYLNSSNISSRIHLHSLYATNPLGWFPWIFQQIPFFDDIKVLETGCGDGTLWTENYDRIPAHCAITLSDISDGMLRDARRAIHSCSETDSRFSFRTFDCQDIPFEDESFDLVLANHVLFYADDLPAALREIRRILKPGGILLCSTYGKQHMQEITQLVQDFDPRIVLSADHLYERFGRDNGADQLAPFFSQVTWKTYEDSLLVPDAEPLISYILSCHGNQAQYILEHYKEFRSFVVRYTRNGFRITKDAGLFLCRK